MKKCPALIFLSFSLGCYDQPYVNLGFSNILDGGPIRPIDGWYYYQYLQNYTAHKFLDGTGNLINNICSPKTKSWNGITEIVYQSKNSLLHARYGIDIFLSYSFSSMVEKNTINITDSGGGLGDLYVGLYLQWDPVMKNDRAVFVHRLEMAASFPTGKELSDTINPGNGFYYISPYWAATLYVMPHLAFSWRVNYYWSAKNKITRIRAGQSFVINFSAEYECINNFWISCVGYYLEQFTNSVKRKQPLPGRKERVLGLGPGVLYRPNENLDFLAYVYFESLARNRSQGISFILRSVVHF